tara:strand:+ start:4288 stop:5142 length:855 start_codon:yes stop_codon:yes gene_type:complete
MESEFYIEGKAWDKVINYARSAYGQFKAEIGGMMVVVKDQDGDWELKDPVIMKQEVTAGNTHLDKDELAKYYTKAAMKYAKEEFRFCWWHSHHTMGAFWSGTDTNTIDEFSDGDFSFALVVNLKEEYKFRVSVWKPIEAHEDVELNILTKEKKVPKKIEDEVKEMCQAGNTAWRHKSLNNNYLRPQETLFNLPYEQNEVPYAQVYKLIDRLHRNLIAGEVTYGDYYRKIQDENERLKTENLGMRIKVLKEEELANELLFSTPTDFIEEEIIDDELTDWNRGFLC